MNAGMTLRVSQRLRTSFGAEAWLRPSILRMASPLYVMHGSAPLFFAWLRHDVMTPPG
jgi:hypothetical protein